MRGELVPVAPEHAQALSAFFARVCPELTPAVWRAKYGPGADRTSAHVWVDGDAVLGHGAYRVEPVRIAGRTLRGAWFMDWHVAPEARGRGGGKALLAAYPQEADVLLALRGTAMSRARFRRWGWRRAVEATHFLLPLSGDLLARRREWQGAAGLAGRAAGRAMAWRARRRVGACALLPDEDLCVTDGPPAACGEAQVSSPIHEEQTAGNRKERGAQDMIGTPPHSGAVRTVQGYAYRCGFPGVRCRTYAVQGPESGAPVARAVALLDTDPAGLSRAKLLDAAVAPDARPRLLASFVCAVVADLAGQAVACVEALAPPGPLARALRQAGFLRRGWAGLWAHPVNDVCAAALDRADPGTWTLGLYDSDLFHR